MVTKTTSCRNPQPVIEQKESPLHRTLGELAITLDELCAMGLLEEFDDHDIVRYKPLNGRTA